MKTVKDLEKSDKVLLTPKDISKILGVDPHSIRIQARTEPEKLGFPVILIGCKTLIPREGFLSFLKFGKAPLITEGEIENIIENRMKEVVRHETLHHTLF